MRALCRAWNCPPSVVRQQDLRDVHHELIFLEAEPKAAQYRTAQQQR